MKFRLKKKSEEKGVKTLAPEPKTELALPLPPAPPTRKESVQVEMTASRKRLNILLDKAVDIESHKKKLKVLPGYACSTCAIGPECPEFKEGYVCAYRDAFSAYDTRDVNSVIEIMGEVLDSNKERYRFARIAEKIANSGMPDPNVTRLSETVMRQAETLMKLQQDVDRITIRTEVEGADTPELNRGGGILSRLFGPTPTALPTVTEKKEIVLNAEGELDRASDIRGL